MKKTAIRLNGEFTATELESIIHSLMEARSSMQPEVPMQAPDLSGMDDPVLHEQVDSFAIRRLLDGRVRFWLRSSGIGWMAFDLAAHHREPLADYLLSEGLTDGHTFH